MTIDRDQVQSLRSVQILQRVTALADGNGSVKGVFSPEDLDTVSIFSRARELLVGTAVSLELGRVIPAFVLQRPLFEDSLFLAELADGDGDHRLARIAWWIVDGHARNKRLMQRRIQHDDEYTEDEVAADRQSTRSQRRGLDERLEKRDAKTIKPLSVDAGAKKYAQPDDLITYEWCHTIVHGGEFGHRLFRQVSEDTTDNWLAPAYVVDGVAFFAARSGIRSIRAINAIKEFYMQKVMVELHLLEVEIHRLEQE